MGGTGLMRIGEVAERTGLSLRTIRYYEEVGLVVPSARSQGGFRLYTDTDVQRLRVIRRIKPLELTLEQTRELLDAIDLVATPSRLTRAERSRILTVLRRYQESVQARCEALREQLATAEAFDTALAGHVAALAGSTAPALPG